MGQVQNSFKMTGITPLKFSRFWIRSLIGPKANSQCGDHSSARAFNIRTFLGKSRQLLNSQSSYWKSNNQSNWLIHWCPFITAWEYTRKSLLLCYLRLFINILTVPLPLNWSNKQELIITNKIFENLELQKSFKISIPNETFLQAVTWTKSSTYTEWLSFYLFRKLYNYGLLEILKKQPPHNALFHLIYSPTKAGPFPANTFLCSIPKE